MGPIIEAVGALRVALDAPSPDARVCMCGHVWEMHGPEVPGCVECQCGHLYDAPQPDAPSPDVETVPEWLVKACLAGLREGWRDEYSVQSVAESVAAHVAVALRGAGLPEWGPPSCVHCGDPLVWHPGNGGQWLGAIPPRDWARCNGIPEGQHHEAPLEALGAGLPEPNGVTDAEVNALARLITASINGSRWRDLTPMDVARHLVRNGVRVTDLEGGDPMTDRACDWCGKPAPEGDALLNIWWADYECCSMECVMLAEAEAREATP